MQNNPLGLQELEIVYQISRIVSDTENIDFALENIINLARKVFIFDNIILYLPNDNLQLEAVHPRAIGRGRSKGADLVWGEQTAYKVMETNNIVSEVEDLSKQIEDRTGIRHYLGIPLHKKEGETRGVLIFIRFGGPPYLIDQIRLAEYIAENVTQLLERERMVNEIAAFKAEKKLEYLQDEFVALISHEILSPLGTIKGYTTTLMREEINPQLKEYNEFLNIIDNEADRLIDLIKLLLDSSRLQIGTLTMDLKPVKINSIIHEAVDRAKTRVENIEIEVVRCKNTGEIRADANRLAQVLDNVLANASKYAPESAITVECHESDKFAHIEIKDNGPGIPKDSLELVFKRFYRVPSPQVNHLPGAGLGLYICRQIIEAHNGNISADAVAGKGTTIKISLPITNSIQRDL
ncbi:MAG: ATP-binding protein [Anaerolineales bacterium]